MFFENLTKLWGALGRERGASDGKFFRIYSQWVMRNRLVYEFWESARGPVWVNYSVLWGRPISYSKNKFTVFSNFGIAAFCFIINISYWFSPSQGNFEFSHTLPSLEWIDTSNWCEFWNNQNKIYQICSDISL